MNNKKFISPEIEKNTIEELSKQLIKANSELRKLQDEREIMFANISHDLRAPMTAIRSAVDLVLSEDNPTREELLSTIELIDMISKTLESLVNDMYFLYSVSNVPKAFEFEEIEAAPFLEEYFFDLKTDSRFEAFDMVLDIEQGMDCVINIDVQKMIRVLDNLFTNAARYASGDKDNKKKTGIRLKAKFDKNRLMVSVKDNGPGISEKDLPYVFMRTYTASGARTPESAKSGSGLGLSIVKAIIEKHKGTIECRSTLGEGSEFIISIPANIRIR